MYSLTESEKRCEAVECELTQIHSRCVRQCPHMSHYLILHPISLIHELELYVFVLLHPFIHKCTCRLAASNLECQELEVAKEAIESELVSAKKRLVHTTTSLDYFLHMLSLPVRPNNFNYSQRKSQLYRSNLSSMESGQ